MQLFGRQAADALAIHGEFRQRPRRRHNIQPGLLQARASVSVAMASISGTI